MSKEAPLLKELRRTNVLSFAGPGIIFPETMSPIDWYMKEPNPEIREFARDWVKAIKQVCGVKDFSDISSLFGEQARQKDAPIGELKKALGLRFREAFAQRHRITISDQEPTGINYGIKLENTRYNRQARLTSKQVDILIKSSIGWANKLRDFLLNPQYGLLKSLSNVMPGSVNEVAGITKGEDLLLMMFSRKWGEQARFEARQILGLADMFAEVLLFRSKYKGLKEEIYDIFNHHGVFKRQEHGPVKTPYNFITKHNPHTFYVEGVQPLKPDERYRPEPNIMFNSLKVREAEDNQGVYLLQINDEPKGIIQTVLKMIRRNTMDPAEIRDHYRMAATFPERSSIDRFMAAIQKASEEAGKPIVIEDVENSLDGDGYEATTNGKSERYAGSSVKYQVMRKKLYFKDRPKLFWEVSCYSLEGNANYFAANNTGIGEYLLRRLIEHDADKVDASVASYLIPSYIYDINVRDYLEAIIAGIRESVREKAYILNKWMSERPIFMSEGEITKAVDRIAEQIQPHSSTIQPDYGRWPQAIIAIGSNSLTAAVALSQRFGAQDIIFYNGKASGAQAFISRLSNSHSKVLILDDVGVNGQTSLALKDALEEKHPDTKVDLGFLAIRSDSNLARFKPYSGSAFNNGEYIFFPPQLHEYVQHTQSVFGICYRFQEGRLEILVQEEQKGDQQKIKLIGGAWDNQLRNDESTPETLRNEIEEELGPNMRRQISSRLINRFPINAQVKLDPDGPDFPGNLLNIRAYYADCQTLDISNFTPPADSNVKRIYWLPVDDAINSVYREGYKVLLREAKEQLLSNT